MVSNDDVRNMPSTSTMSEEPSTSTQSEKSVISKNKSTKNFHQNDLESSEGSEVISYRESGSSPMCEFDDMSEGETPERNTVVNDDIKPKIGNYVITRYEGNFYPGIITNLKENEVCVSAMDLVPIGSGLTRKMNYFMMFPK